MILYQVYPRSFGEAPSNGGVGDLRGLLAKLPYLAGLGVDSVWISPFVKSPMKDFGYDVADYCAIDPIFGTMADFDAVIERAGELGLRIMIDMVLSHSSDEHPWFKESRKGRTGDKSDWYVWADAKKDGGAPNNWQSLFGGSAWQWDEGRKQFYLHNFLRSQPDFNFHAPALRKALLEACEFWLKRGVRGFRLDVCNFYFHDRSLKDNPPRDSSQRKTDGVHAGNPYNFQMHVHDKDQPENLQFLRDLRALVDRYESTVLMGEIVSDDSLKIMSDYIAGGGPLHTAYSFALFNDAFDGRHFAEVLREVERRLRNGRPTWALGNHDVPRYISRFKADAGWPQSAKCLLAFLFVLRGNIILYQGDELGLDEAEIPIALMQDPFGIEFYPEFKGRDGCRTPMPWSSQRPTAKTWLPIPDSHLERSVANQERQEASVLAFTRTLIAWRKEHPWLETAPLEVKHASRDVIVIERMIGNGRSFFAAINGGSSSQSVDLGAPHQHLQLAAYESRFWG